MDLRLAALLSPPFKRLGILGQKCPRLNKLGQKSQIVPGEKGNNMIDNPLGRAWSFLTMGKHIKL